MGTSTNAMLLYGYHLGSDDDWLLDGAGEYGELPTLDWFDPDAEDEGGPDFIEAAQERLLAEIAGFTETDWSADGYFARKRAAEELVGVEFEPHCSADYPMWVLCAKRLVAYCAHTEADLGRTPPTSDENGALLMRERTPVDDQTRLACLQLLIGPELPAGLRLRVGGKVGRHLYAEGDGLPDGGVDIGKVDTGALAELVAAAFNTHIDGPKDQRRCPATDPHHGQCDLYQGHHQPDDPTSRHLTGAMRWADPAQQAAAEPLTSFAGSVPDLTSEEDKVADIDPEAFRYPAGDALIRHYEQLGWYDPVDPYGAGAAVVEALLTDEKLIDYVRRSLTADEGEGEPGAG